MPPRFLPADQLNHAILCIRVALDRIPNALDAHFLNMALVGFAYGVLLSKPPAFVAAVLSRAMAFTSSSCLLVTHEGVNAMARESAAAAIAFHTFSAC